MYNRPNSPLIPSIPTSGYAVKARRWNGIGIPPGLSGLGEPLGLSEVGRSILVRQYAPERYGERGALRSALMKWEEIRSALTRSDEPRGLSVAGRSAG